MCMYEREPIDVVYTWVNGSDSLFQKLLKNHTSPLWNSSCNDKSQARYFDRHELKFSLRSLEKYAPWIRNVYIITNGQIPYWLNLDYERVILVTHEEIFSNLSDLPTFSSPAIETHIHKIPGLSKKFLYFNDDIYLGAPVYLSDFYSEDLGYLIYLDYPMQNCAANCPWLSVHDGQCDHSCNVAACQMDGGDCNLKQSDKTQVDNDLNVTYLKYIKSNVQLNRTQSSHKARVKVETLQLNTVIQVLPPKLKKSSIKHLVETHNRKKILKDKLNRRKRKGKRMKVVKDYFDAYLESLQYTNRLLNTHYGFILRYVPAHMPFLIDKDIMSELHRKFKSEFDMTSQHKFRTKNDMQFSLSYFYYLISEKVNVSIEEIFDNFDTDKSGTWSDREIRTVLTRINDLPLSTINIDDFDALLINCSRIVQAKPVPTPEFERYIDSILPAISKELITKCNDIKEILLEKFGQRSKYLYNIIKNISKYVTFEMIESSTLSAVLKLDKIRKTPTKFVCINDNVYRKYNLTTINAIWYDFYLSLFPLPSKFELPSEYRSRFAYVKDLKAYQLRMSIYMYGYVLSIYFIIWFLCRNNIIYIWNKLFP
ncbi:stealth protein cr1 conserved region 1 [Holotrichia oblita]|uniref:Stealth protein cr1 conserved region 1 n=1 Tax=Holotrichia oblita TaxID=644536 RepID=A0ACB9SHJ8_HOLOL|nr:stealth protein cr1 conserved region 1 [Holotrichia oblita]